MGYLSLSPPAPMSQFTAAYQIGWVVAINTTALRLRQLGYPTVGGFPTPPRRFAGMFVEAFEARANKEPLTHRLWPHGHGIELAMVAADAAVNECGVDVGFVDGFDSLGVTRSTGGRDVGEMLRVTNTMLRCMDRIRDTHLGVIIACTNVPDMIDGALQSRFDEILQFEVPTSTNTRFGDGTAQNTRHATELPSAPMGDRDEVESHHWSVSPRADEGARSSRPTGRLILLCGVAGAGKTTLAKQMEANGAVRMCPDEWLVALGFDIYDPDARIAIEQLQWGLSQQLAQRGLTVVDECGVWRRSQRDLRRTWAREHGVAIELRFLDAPVDVLTARVAARNRALPEGAPHIDPALVAFWADRIERPDPEELALFDSPKRSWI